MATVTRMIGTGGDYTTLQAWLDAIAANPGAMYAAGDVADGALLNSVLLTSQAVLPACPVALLRAQLRPFVGLRHTGQPGTGIEIACNSGTQSIIIGNSNNYAFTVEDLELRRSVASGTYNSGHGINWGVTYLLTAERCIFSGQYSADNGPAVISGAIYAAKTGAATVVKAIRCLFTNYGNPGGGVGNAAIVTKYCDAQVDACTIDNMSHYGIVAAEAGAVATVRNTIATRCPSNCYHLTTGAAFAGDRNGDDDGTAAAYFANRWTSPAATEFQNAGGGNYELNNPGAVAIDSGAALGTADDAHLDLKGEDESAEDPWDAGCLISGGGVIVTDRTTGSRFRTRRLNG